mmetsp:Transcript_35097/g.76721  ORF Transcript_35097/g.76721 Transcript_35097/m.76721 type:complete len:217 (+) Transcript_35097:1063-1713(+)
MSSLLPASAMIVVLLLVITTLRATPRDSTSAVATERPRSVAMYSAPVMIAMSCRRALRRSPKPGALMAATLSTPRSLFTTRVASASPATSSAISSRGADAWVVFSRRGRMSLMAWSFWSVTSTRTFSISTTLFSWFVMNWGEMYPRSISRPSSTSTVVSRELEDSMESTPSGPTFSMALAIISPISSSLPAEMDATALMSEEPLTGWAFSARRSTR